MPKTPAVYEECLIAQTLTLDVLEEDKLSPRPQFEHVDPKKIKFLIKKGVSKSCYAAIAGVKGWWTKVTDYRYVIIISEQPFMSKSESVQKKIIEHELTHISHDFDGETYKHNVQDFSSIIQKYGINYAEEVDALNECHHSNESNNIKSSSEDTGD